MKLAASFDRLMSAHWRYVLLAFLLLFLLTNTVVWLGMDTRDLTWDPAVHYTNSLQYYNAFSSFSSPDMLQVQNKFWPPLPHIAPVPFYFLGRSPDTAIAIQSFLFTAVLLLSVYGLGRKLGSPTVGLVAAFLVAFYPITVLHSRRFAADLPLTAVVCLSLYLLLLSDSFRNRKYSLLFGLSLGLGFLTKLTFPVFVFGPAAFVVLRAGFALYRRRRTSEQYHGNTAAVRRVILGQAANVGMALAVGALVTLPWYLPYWDSIQANLLQNVGITSEASRPFILGMIENSSFLLFLASMAGLIYLAVRRRLMNRRLAFLAAWLLVSYAVLSLQANQQPRYIMPAIPALALLAGIAFDSLPRIGARFAVGGTVAVVCLLQFFSLSYGAPRLGPVTVGPVAILAAPSAPGSKSLNAEEAVNLMGSSLASDGIHYVAAIPEIEIYPSLLTAIELGNTEQATPRLRIMKVGERPTKLLYSAYIVHLVDSQTGEWRFAQEATSEYNRQIQEAAYRAQDWLVANGAGFSVLGTVDVGDGHELVVYENESPFGAHLAPAERYPDTGKVAITDIVADGRRFRNGEKVTVTVSLANVGEIAYDALVRVYLDSEGGHLPWKEAGGPLAEVYASQTVMLAPGQQGIVPVVITIPGASGTYDLSSTVVVRAEGEEYRHGDFAYSTMKVEIEGPQRKEVADKVQITAVVPDKTAYESGETMTVDVSVKNIDSVERTVSVQFFLDEPGGAPAWDEREGRVMASVAVEATLISRSMKTLSIPGNAPAWDGAHVLTARVIVLGEDGEPLDTHSFSTRRQVEITGANLGESWQPDTDRVAVVRITPETSVWTQGDEAVVTIKLKNLGERGYYAITYVYLDSPGGEAPWNEPGGPLLEMKEMRNGRVFLEPGEEAMVVMSATVPANPGEYDLSVRCVAREEGADYAHSDMAYALGRVTISGP